MKEEAEEGLPEGADLPMQVAEEAAADAGRETELEVADPPPSPVNGTILPLQRSHRTVGESNRKQLSHLLKQ